MENANEESFFLLLTPIVAGATIEEMNTPQERITRANELAAQGMAPRDIAAEMGMTHSALRSMMKRAGRKFVVMAAQFLPVEEGNTRRKQDTER